MDAQLSAPLIKKRKPDSSDSALAQVAPPPPIKKIKRPSTIVDEETYLDGLSRIIARDYFPGLATTDAKRDFLDALESKDEGWIHETSSRLNLMLDGHYVTSRRGVAFSQTTNTATPRGFAGSTPVRTPAPSRTAARSQIDVSMGLGAYQAKYTSEDNESFNALVDKQNLQNRARHAYLFSGNQIPTSRQLAWREREARLLEAAKSSMDLALYRRDRRPAMPDVKPSAAKNALMFAPDSIEDTHQTIVSVAEANSNAPPKSILFDNTRLTQDGVARPTPVPQSPSLSAIDDAIAGRPRLTSSEAGWETPRVAGYAFVDAEPTIAESQAYNDKNGTNQEAMATLFRITRDVDKTPGRFAIHEASNRETLHHKMVDKLDRGRRESTQGRGTATALVPTPGRTATPKFNSAPKKEAGHLTPAAQLLYSKFQSRRNIEGERTPILDFDMTPKPVVHKKVPLIPGLTPKRSALRKG